MGSKVCTKCKEEKLLDCFYNHSEGKFGKDSRCNDCHRYFTVSEASYKKEILDGK